MEEDREIIGNKKNNTLYIAGAIFILLILGFSGYLYYAYKNNMMPFDDPKRSFSKNSTMVPLIKDPKITPLTPQQIANRNSFASQIKSS